MLYLLLATYGTILLTELLGDKTLYTASSLVTRFRPLPVFCGVTIAFMGKMLLAVLAGQTITQLPTTITALSTTLTFFATAAIVGLKKRPIASSAHNNPTHASKAILIAFAAMFFSEWGDIGQVTAATLTARYHAPVIVWAGATLALVTKGILAMTLGVGLRKCVPINILRPVSVCLCLILGIVSALDLVHK